MKYLLFVVAILNAKATRILQQQRGGRQDNRGQGQRPEITCTDDHEVHWVCFSDNVLYDIPCGSTQPAQDLRPVLNCGDLSDADCTSQCATRIANGESDEPEHHDDDHGFAPPNGNNTQPAENRTDDRGQGGRNGGQGGQGGRGGQRPGDFNHGPRPSNSTSASS